MQKAVATNAFSRNIIGNLFFFFSLFSSFLFSVLGLFSRVHTGCTVEGVKPCLSVYLTWVHKRQIAMSFQ